MRHFTNRAAPDLGAELQRALQELWFSSVVSGSDRAAGQLVLCCVPTPHTAKRDGNSHLLPKLHKKSSRPYKSALLGTRGRILRLMCVVARQVRDGQSEQHHAHDAGQTPADCADDR